MYNLEIEIKELFKKWKEEHKKDILYEFDTPRFKGKLIPKETFINDGFCISKSIKENTILYISKESHEYNKSSNTNEVKQHEYTWLKDCFTEGKNLIFPRRIKMMQEILEKDMDDITFMNINKRGGFANTDMVILNTYAMQFSDNIIKEIEIINPEMIICCGSGLKRIIEMIYKKHNKQINKNIIEVFHPSFVISDKKYKDYFIKQLNSINKKI